MPTDKLAEPLVVAAKIDNELKIVALDTEASRLGLSIGMPLATARAMHPTLDIVDHDPQADAALLVNVAEWCDRFTPLVALDQPNGLLLDVSGCAHLFGGETALMQKLYTALTAQGFSARAAIAGTPMASRALARSRHGTIVAAGGEKEAVSLLPIAALGADQTITRGLRRAGLKTIGEVAARGRHEIASRFGSVFVDRLREALGETDTPISPRKPAPDYVVEKRFADPVATSNVIATTLAFLAQMLIAAMERNGKGARRMEASFFRTDGAVRSIVVETGQPVADARILDRLFDEKLDALSDPLDPGFGFDLIRLSASRTVDVAATQQDFDSHVHDAGDVSQLIDRLAARLGSRRVVRYVPADTHIPERASVTMPAQQPVSSLAWPARMPQEPPLRPLLMFGAPQRIDVVAQFPHGPPAGFQWRRSFRRLARIEGPERIAMEWWRHSDLQIPQTDPTFAQRDAPQEGEVVDTVDGRIMTRDYFRAEDAQGIRYWIYREGIYKREVGCFRWFLHGLFA